MPFAGFAPPFGAPFMHPLFAALHAGQLGPMMAGGGGGMLPEALLVNQLNRDFLLNMARQHQLANMLRPQMHNAIISSTAPKTDLSPTPTVVTPTTPTAVTSAPPTQTTGATAVVGSGKKGRSNALDISNLIN